MLAQEVEVKNGAGVVVPVKPLDIAAGDKTAEFEFVTAVKADDLKGVWTVNGQSYNLGGTQGDGSFVSLEKVPYV